VGAAPLGAVIVLASVGLAGLAGAAQAPALRGSYHLVKRTLADGTVIAPPALEGFQTWTREYRNFNVGWTDKDGKHVSISLIARYDMAGGKYCEHPVYWLANNMGAPGLSYDWPKEKATECSAVTTNGQKMTFAIKGEPVVVTIDANGMTATAAGMFTDTWERVH